MKLRTQNFTTSKLIYVFLVNLAKVRKLLDLLLITFLCVSLFSRFGSGGKQESVNAICILALNIINDKVFLVVWWWFLVLIFLGLSRLVFRLIQVNSVRLRFYMLNLRMHRYENNSYCFLNLCLTSSS